MEAGDDGAPNFYSRKSCNYVRDTVVTCVDLLVGDCYSEDEVDTMRASRFDDVIAHLERAEEWDSDLCPSVKEYKEGAAAGDDDVNQAEEAIAEGSGLAQGDGDADAVDDTDADTDGDGEPDADADTDGEGEPDADADTDGDGEPDADTDGDGEPDADTDGDGEPDADTDGDGEPDDVDMDTMEGEDHTAKSGSAYDDDDETDGGEEGSGDHGQEGDGDFDSGSTLALLCGPLLILQLLVINM